jgi:hypothetical protein
MESGRYALRPITHEELGKSLHQFGNPSVSRMYTILKRARPEEVEGLMGALIEIKEKYSTCAELARAPNYFKVTIGTGDLRFNQTVAVDVMYLKIRPVLHIVDEALLNVGV